MTLLHISLLLSCLFASPSPFAQNLETPHVKNWEASSTSHLIDVIDYIEDLYNYQHAQNPNEVHAGVSNYQNLLAFIQNALSQPIFFAKTKTLKELPLELGSYMPLGVQFDPNQDIISIVYQGGKVKVSQKYKVKDISPVIANPDYVADYVEFNVQYELNPYELVSVHFLDNYASALGYDAGTNIQVPAYYLLFFNESIDHANWQYNFRVVTDAIEIGACVAAAVSAPFTLGGSLAVLGAVAATYDLSVAANQQNATTSELAIYQDWDAFYGYFQLATGAGAAYTLVKNVSLARTLVHLRKFKRNLANLPSNASSKLLAVRSMLMGVSGAGQDWLALLNKQKQRLQNLQTQYGNLDFNDFTPIGGKTKNDISSSMYNEMFSDLSSRANWTTQQKADKIVEILGSAKTVPQKVTYQQGDELYKVVKKGSVPSPTSEYWLTKAELDDLMSKGSNLESKSGLPLGSMAEEYDIYKITANQQAPTYQSIIAPTNQRGYATTGGATQTLVLDRSLWSAPVKYNTQSFIPDF